MNTKITILVVLTSGLVLNGCGGSSGGSSSEDTTLTELSPDNVDRLSRSAANAIPGCDYKTDDTMGLRSKSGITRMMSRTFKQAINQYRASVSSIGNRSLRAETIDETTEGNCPSNPGSFRVVGSEDNGIAVTSVTYSDYCVGDDIEYSVVNGRLDLRGEADISGAESIPESLSVSTGSNGIEAIVTATEGVFTYNLNIDDFLLTIGNGLDDPTAANPNTLTLDSLSILDGRSNSTFKLFDVDIVSYLSGTDNVGQINSLFYTDPENGTIGISSTLIVTNEDGIVTSGSITLTGANSTTVSLNLSETVENSFDVTDENGQLAGVMVCSGV